MLKQGGAVEGGRLDHRVGVRGAWPHADQGRPRPEAAIGALALEQHATVEELHLLARLVRGLGSENIDHRSRGTPISPISVNPPSQARPHAGWVRPSPRCPNLQRVLVVGSFLRKDHPLFAAAPPPRRAQGCAGCTACMRWHDDWLMPSGHAADRCSTSSAWLQSLADIASGRGRRQGQSTRRWLAAASDRGEGRSPTRCSPASARPCCSATPQLSIRRPARCSRWRTGSPRRPAPRSATSTEAGQHRRCATRRCPAGRGRPQRRARCSVPRQRQL